MFQPVNVVQRFDYDLAGLLKRERPVNGRAPSPAQDAYYPTGELHSKQMANGVWTGAYGYDLAGLLYGVGNSLFTGANGASEPSSFIAATLYNARGQTTSITYGSGRQAIYSYQDNRGWLMGVEARNGATSLMNQTYTRKTNGQIRTVTMAGDLTRSWTYTYDPYGQLISADNGNGTAEDRTFAYDLAGNLTRNSGLCATTPDMVYPAAGLAGPASLHKHAPNTICGGTVNYDGNGNTLAYDSDGSGPKPSRALVYDGENRPIAVTKGGVTTVFQYGPDGERTKRSYLAGASPTAIWYMGNDTELLVDAANPAGLLTSYPHPDVKREGQPPTSW